MNNEEQKVNSTDGQKEEFASILGNDANSNESKPKGNKPIILLIIGLLLVLLICIGVSKFLNDNQDKKPNNEIVENVYYNAIDKLSDDFIKYLNDSSNITKKIHGGNASVKLNLQSNNTDYKDIFDIVNKMEFNLDFAIDYANKKLSSDYNIKYDNADLIKGDIFMNKNNMYLDLGSLYNKVIKLTNENTDISDIWNTNTEHMEVIIKELATIIKQNLNEKYFSRIEQQIKVLGKDVDTYKHSLVINKEDFKTIMTAIVNDIKKDEDLLTALTAFLNITKQELLSNLDEYVKDSAEITDDITINVYLNKTNSELEKIEVKSGDEVTFEKKSQGTFDIIYEKNSVGELKYNDNEISFTVKEPTENITLSFSLKENEIKVVMNSSETSLNIVIKDNNDQLKINVTFADKQSDIKGTAVIDIKEKKVTEVKDKNVTNSININDMTDAETNIIMNNLYQNETFMSLLGKIMGSSEMQS